MDSIEDLSDIELTDYVNEHFYAIYSANFRQSLELTARAVEFAATNSWVEKEALAQKNYGIVLYLTGDYEHALSAYLRSYDLYDSLGDKSGLAQVCNEMGNYFQKQSDFERALELWAQSEQLATEVNDLTTLGTSLGMQASFYWLRGDYQKSDPLYTRCYEIRKQENDSVGLGYILLDLADIERRKGNFQGALNHFNNSTQIRKIIGDRQGVLENHKSLADLYYNEGQYQAAISQYQKAATESQEFGYPDLTRKAYDSLSSAYKLLGDYRRSLEYKIHAENIEDSLFNIERAAIISELETQYETEKNERLIAQQEVELTEQEATIARNSILLAASALTLVLLIFIGILWRNRISKQAKIELQQMHISAKEAEVRSTISSQEQERARYARDLHDGFGQLISTLNLNLAGLPKISSSAEGQEVYNTTTDVIEEMYMELKNICFDMMPQTLVNGGLEPAIAEFASRVSEAGSIKVETSFFGLGSRLPENKEVAVFRIVQEWINNILKHGTAKTVTVQITADENETTLMIEDDGDGFDKNLLVGSTGNGWRNINSRTSLISGSLELETTLGSKGSTLILNIPESQNQSVMAESSN